MTVPAGGRAGTVAGAQLDARVAALNRALQAHAGGIEVTGVADATVTIRYTGMCTGCPFRPVTTAATVRPALLELPGVAAVAVDGLRISEEAERRLTEALAPRGAWPRAPRRAAAAGPRPRDRASDR